MSEQASNQTGHDFAELTTTTAARAQSLTMLLRSHAVDARTRGGTVLVPREALEEAQAHLRLSMQEHGIEPDEESLNAATCPKCGYSLAAHGSVGVCPECGASFLQTPPVVSRKLRAKRERARPVLVALLVLFAIVFGLVKGVLVLW